MKKLFSFLGTSQYVECYYTYGQNKATYTRFVQTAIFELLLTQGIIIDEVTLFVTNDAEVKNWYDSIGQDGKPLVGLKNSWANILPGQLSKLKIVKISDKQDEAALWRMFNQIYEEIDNGDEVYLDITHSFRSIPIVSLIISNYIRVMKNASIEKLLYGNFESLGNSKVVANMPKEQRLAPIHEITEMLSLFDWTNGVDAFIRTGNPGIIQDLAKKAQSQEFHNQDLRGIRYLADQLRKVSMSIETCRGKTIEKEIINTKHGITKLKDSSPTKLQPFLKLMDKIEEKFAPFEQGHSVLNTPAIVYWCLDHHLYQQGYTILQEGIINLFAELAGVDKVDRNQRKLLSDTINIIAGKIPKEKRKIKDEELEIFSNYMEIILPYQADLAFYTVLTTYRNNINHFDMNKNGLSYNKIADHLSKLLGLALPLFKKIDKLLR